MRILGWALFALNILGLVYCIYHLQPEPSLTYLLGTLIFLAQTIYIAKTLSLLKKFETAKEDLEEAVKKASLGMVRMVSGEKGKKGDKEK